MFHGFGTWQIIKQACVCRVLNALWTFDSLHPFPHVRSWGRTIRWLVSIKLSTLFTTRGAFIALVVLLSTQNYLRSRLALIYNYTPWSRNQTLSGAQHTVPPFVLFWEVGGKCLTLAAVETNKCTLELFFFLLFIGLNSHETSTYLTATPVIVV